VTFQEGSMKQLSGFVVIPNAIRVVIRIVIGIALGLHPGLPRQRRAVMTDHAAARFLDQAAWGPTPAALPNCSKWASITG